MITLNDSDSYNAILLLKEISEISDDNSKYEIPLAFIEFIYNDFSDMMLKSKFDDINYVYVNLESYNFNVLYSPLHKMFYVSNSSSNFYMYTLLKVNLTSSFDKKTSPVAKLLIDRFEKTIDIETFNKKILKYFKDRIKKKLVSYQKEVTKLIIADEYKEESFEDIINENSSHPHNYYFYSQSSSIFITSDNFIDFFEDNSLDSKNKENLFRCLSNNMSIFDLMYLIKKFDSKYMESVTNISFDGLSKFKYDLNFYYFKLNPAVYFTIKYFYKDILCVTSKININANDIFKIINESNEISIYKNIKDLEYQMANYATLSRSIDQIYNFVKN